MECFTDNDSIILGFVVGILLGLIALKLGIFVRKFFG